MKGVWRTNVIGVCERHCSSPALGYEAELFTTALLAPEISLMFMALKRRAS